MIRIAYADPPYIGQARRHYNCAEIDHVQLLAYLQSTFVDGWALSLSSPTLRQLLPLCPEPARIGAWVKPFCALKRGVRPAYAWEPVIFSGGRNPINGHPHPPPPKGGAPTTPKDFVSCSIELKKGLVGAKPEPVCLWILDLLGVRAGDHVHDLFPGTGAMGRAALRIGAIPFVPDGSTRWRRVV